MAPQTARAPAMRLAYQVAFWGCRGRSFPPFDGLFRSEADARCAARRWDGCGLRYGAFARTVRVPADEYDRRVPV